MSFDRWNNHEPRSWAYSVFKSYHTHLNRLLWAQIPASDFVEKQVAITLGDVHSILGCKAEDVRTIRSDKQLWKEDYREFNNWARLNAMMSLNSYLEIYLSSIISTAIESDPGVLHNASRKIDGAVMLKHGKNYNYSYQASKCTVGQWSQRISEFRSIFGQVPTALNDNVGELEKLRILRNNVGHAFGRDIDKSRKKGNRTIIESERISLKRTKEILGITHIIVEGIDDFLLRNHIGEYEALYHYHELKKEMKSTLVLSQRAALFKKSIGKEGALPRSKSYCNELISYYENM
jgi:hypothetical protein